MAQSLPQVDITGYRTPDAPRAELLEACVRCGACVQSCPTYQELGIEPDDPRGRVFLITAVHDHQLPINKSFEKHIYRCLDCRACETVCPMGVQVGRLIEEARGEIRQVLPARGWYGRILRLVLTQLFPYPWRMELVAQLMALSQRSGLITLARRLGLTRLLPEHLAKMERHMPTPPIMSARRRLGAGVAAWGETRGRVALLHGCVMNTLFAGATEATARVLARNGWEVALPAGQTCCGALHVHEGDRGGGKRLARQNIAAFEASGAEVYLVNAAGCGSAFKEYGILLEHDPEWAERAAAFSAKVSDVQEFLVETGYLAPEETFKAKAVYQDACHLAHAQRIRNQPRELLRSVPGLELKEMPDSDRCCGSAGIYNISHPDIAEPLLKRKVADVPEDAELLVTANPGCHLQLARGLKEVGREVRVMHVMEVLDAAYERKRP
jgi:glycolate oxidase iron-sulfur subunit